MRLGDLSRFLEKIWDLSKNCGEIKGFKVWGRCEGEGALGSSEEGKNVSETAFLLFWRFDFRFFFRLRRSSV